LTILRLDPPIPLETPRGQGYAHFLQDAGDERDMLWTVFHEDGQIWTWPNYEVRCCRNVTLSRPNPEKPMSFKSVQKKIERKDGVSKKSAGAILASASRNASAKAKKVNPKLKRVK
jgi:hypothetical protein